VAETTGAELVLVTRGKAVNDKMNTDYPHLGKVAKRYIRSASGWAAGTIAGERASLGKQIANE
jgi:hypothetical protein